MKKQRLSLSRRQAIIGVVFLLPFLIHFSMFLIYPFFSTAYTSLTNANLMSLTEKFVGLKNYQNVLKDMYRFICKVWMTMRRSMRYMKGTCHSHIQLAKSLLRISL